LADGERGELVFTTLTKEAMPVIRYRTRDLTRLLPGTARSLRRMEKISGRSDDMVIVRGVNVFPSQIEEQILRSPALSGHYQMILTRDNRMDMLTVAVEARPEEWGANLAGEEAELIARIKQHVGVSTTVTVLAPGSIERSVGKARRVLDRRPRE
jgi:phenylacetate-CoA ligase